MTDEMHFDFTEGTVEEATSIRANCRMVATKVDLYRFPDKFRCERGFDR